MPAVYRGSLSFVKWLDCTDYDKGPSLGDSSQNFNIRNPLGAKLTEKLKPGAIVLIGFTPRLTGANLAFPSLDPQWVTLLKKPDNINLKK